MKSARGKSTTDAKPRKSAPAVKPKRKAAPPARRAAASRMAPRADFGAPIDGFFVKQAAPLRPILEELRKLVEEAIPDAESSIKWGMPVYTLGGSMVVALGAHKSHVNLILSGPSGAFSDPEGRLEGESKLGRHLKLRTLDDLPRPAVRGWLRTAAELARKKK